jgi:hypothetical protein
MVPEGPCEMAWQARFGSQRHYCENSATCVLILDDDEDAYASCDACRSEMVELGVSFREV